MAKPREQLHEILVQILNSRNVYFQPPESVKMKYPAIVYARSDFQNRHADDGVYTQQTVYEVTVIDANPDSDLVRRVSFLPFCRFNRHYKADNLNHDVFTLYY